MKYTANINTKLLTLSSMEVEDNLNIAKTENDILVWERDAIQLTITKKQKRLTTLMQEYTNENGSVEDYSDNSEISELQLELEQLHEKLMEKKISLLANKRLVQQTTNDMYDFISTVADIRDENGVATHVKDIPITDVRGIFDAIATQKNGLTDPNG